MGEEKTKNLLTQGVFCALGWPAPDVAGQDL
jgi:hypothetical protein